MQLSHLINNTWTGLFEYTEDRISIMNIIYEIVGFYPQLDDYGYALTNFIKQSPSRNIPYDNRVYPKLYDIFRPFRYSLLRFVKVVLLYDEPHVNGLDTGIPFYYDIDACALLPQNYSYVNTQEMTVLADALSKHKSDPTLFPEGIPGKYIMKWINQGVLPLRASWTNSKYGTHCDFWFDYTIAFLNALHEFDNRILVIALGDKASYVASYSELNLNTIYIEEFESSYRINSYPNSSNLNGMFEATNNLLIDLGRQPINW